MRINRNHCRKRTILLTGGTGLVGSYLLKTFLEDGHSVYALSRHKGIKDERQRILDALAFWDSSLLKKTKALTVLEGDIEKCDLGLQSKTLEVLRNAIGEIYHAAASTNLNLPLSKARRTNVTGTRNVFETALRISQRGKLKKVNHISTAFVCGNYTESFTERDLSVGQEFNSTYEQSKFEAEGLAVDYREKGLWIDIYRPPIIISDSKTGKIPIFKNIFQIVDLIKLNLFPILPIRGSYVYTVPIDVLCKAIYTISSNSNIKNACYHPFSSQRVLLSQLINVACDYLSLEKPHMVHADSSDLRNTITHAQSSLLNSITSIINYEARLKTDFTKSVLKHYSFSFPRLDNSFFRLMFSYCFNSKARKHGSY